MKRSALFFILTIVFLSNSSCTEKTDPINPIVIKEEPKSVYIYSVIATPTISESVTLKNNYGISTNIKGWIIGDANNPSAYIIPNNTILTQNAFIIFAASTMGFGINDKNETIFLKDMYGNTINMWSN